MLNNSKTILTLAALMATLVLGCATQKEQPKPEPVAEESAAKALSRKEKPAPALTPEAPVAAAQHKGHGHISFEQVDTNHDGFLSKEEINAGHLKRLDADGNGHISKEEYAAHRAKRGHKGCPYKGDAAGKCDCPNCAGKPECDCENCPEKSECPHKRLTFEECDANADGAVTLAELQKGDRLLKIMDTDKDGRISKAEYDAHHQGRQKGGHGHGHGGHGDAHGHGHAH